MNVENTKRIDGTKDVPQLVSKLRVKNVLFVVSMMLALQLSAQKDTQPINISVTQSTSPLIERWISEYSKVNPDAKFIISNNTPDDYQSDIKATANYLQKSEINQNETVDKVGKLVLLPVINEQNQLFAKELKKGLKYNELKSLFFNEEESEWEEEKKIEEPLYTVYTKNPQSGSARIFSNYFGLASSELKGVYVSGDDSRLIKQLIQDTTGVSFSNLGSIYNLESREPIKGIKILPIDLNNNGKLDKDESVFNNLDLLISFLENTKGTSAPSDYLNFIVDKEKASPDVLNFINWVKQNGQQFNHQYGFLSVGNLKQTELTQK